MLTRPQFDTACKTLIARYADSASDSVATSPLEGWVWHEHTSYPNFGYMSRVVNVFHRPDALTDPLEEPLGEEEALEEVDPTVLSNASGSEALVCQEYVTFSSTFRVPTFYFLLCDSSGVSLPLSEVLRTSLFKVHAWDRVEISSYAVSLPTSTFPLLSYGDHPTLGVPCWYFHPCETTAAVDELLREVFRDDWDEQAKIVRWLELWFLVLCSVVNL